jgi:hypothetical protein
MIINNMMRGFHEKLADDGRRNRNIPGHEYEQVYAEVYRQVYKQVFDEGYHTGKRDGYQIGYDDATRDHQHNEQAASCNRISDMRWHGKKSESWAWV